MTLRFPCRWRHAPAWLLVGLYLAWQAWPQVSLWLGAAGAQGSTLPAFTLTDYRGRVFHSRDLRGRVLLINFWADWCAPCRKELPQLQTLQQARRDRGLVVLAVSLDPLPTAAVTHLARALDLDLPLVGDPRELPRQLGGVRVTPTTVLIDRRGRIRARIAGVTDPLDLTARVDRLLNPPDASDPGDS